jgi:hypothetical protein
VSLLEDDAQAMDSAAAAIAGAEAGFAGASQIKRKILTAATFHNAFACCLS